MRDTLPIESPAAPPDAAPTPIEWALLAAVCAIGMGATLHLHQLVNGSSLGIRFEPVRLALLLLLHALLGVAMWRAGLVPAVGRVLRSTPALCALLGLAWLSTLWSIDPPRTLSRSLLLSGTAVVGLYLGLRCALDGISTLILALAAALAMATLLGVWLSPGLALEPTVDSGAWRGPFEHKNYLGRAMLIGCVALLPRLIAPGSGTGRRLGYGALGVLLLAALLLSRSATARLLAVMAVGLFLYLPYLLRPTTRRQRAVAIGGAALGVGLVAAVLWQPAEALALLGRDSTLTGRVELWQAVLPHLRREIWLGYGYDAFWDHFDEPVERALNWDWVGQADNGYIDLVLDAGVLAPVLFGVALVTVCVASVRFYRRDPQRKNLFPVVALFCFASLNVVESHLVRFDDFWWLLFCSIVALTSLEGSRRHVGPSPDRS